jgi:hypothetical protein
VVITPLPGLTRLPAPEFARQFHRWGEQAREAEIHLGRVDGGLSGFHCCAARLDLRFGGFDTSFRGFDLGSGGDVIMHGVVEFLLGDRLLFCEGRVFVYVHLCSSPIRHRLGELGSSLHQLRVSLRQLPFGLCELSIRLIESAA